MSPTNRTVLAGALGFAAAALTYAVGIEPCFIETVYAEISLPRLPRAFDGYTILQLSDFHTRRFGRRERIVRGILGRLPRPDLAVITGDLIHTPAGEANFLRTVAELEAADGVYAIFGNSEHKNGVRPSAFAQELDRNGITPLLNKHVILEREGSSIALVGVDDPVSVKDDMKTAMEGLSDSIFKLLLMHTPDGISEAAVRGIDLSLCGHTHGGQVKLPIYGPIYTHSHLGRRMSHGYYAGKELKDIIGIRPGRTQLYVTRGVGVSGLALRFLCRPEITVITLRKGLPGIQYG
jgi:predicted MPP superfamily phosphohydrolase